MSPVNIGILGLGTVGCGTVTVLERNCDEIARRAGRQIKVIRAVVKDLSKARNLSGSSVELNDDPYFVLDCDQIDIVVELMGGLEPASEYVTYALKKGKHVVTANKELLAERGHALFQTAQESSVVIAFEAAVGGGISIIKALREALTGNLIESLVGIINGTSNYILTEMSASGSSFEEVLAQAQKAGYAESDPTFDVEGVDAVHKLILLASIAFGIPLQKVDSVFREGIGAVTFDDIAYARELGFTIKPLAITRKGENGIELRVHPTLIARTDILSSVNGVMNAIIVQGDAVGKTLFYGAGAGAEPTASAVVADIVDVARVLTSDPENRVPHLAFQPNALSHRPIAPAGCFVTSNYLRLHALNLAGVLADITKILGNQGISIETIIQKSAGPPGETVPIVILTQATAEEKIRLAQQQLENLDAVVGPIMRIRILDGS